MTSPTHPRKNSSWTKDRYWCDGITLLWILVQTVAYRPEEVVPEIVLQIIVPVSCQIVHNRSGGGLVNGLVIDTDACDWVQGFWVFGFVTITLDWIRRKYIVTCECVYEFTTWCVYLFITGYSSVGSTLNTAPDRQVAILKEGRSRKRFFPHFKNLFFAIFAMTEMSTFKDTCSQCWKLKASYVSFVWLY